MNILKSIAATGVIALAGGPAAFADDMDSRERISFIEDRLDSGRRVAARWQNGWSAIYVGAAVVHGGLALASDDNDDRVVNSVSALRAIAAITLMRIRPDPGRQGADPIRSAGPIGSPERLQAAEELLRQSAHHAGQRNAPGRHFLNVGINAFFGGLVWAFGDSDDAVRSTLLGIVGGEAALLTRSRQPLRNLDDYGSRFASRLDWRVVPVAGGIGIQVKF